MYLILIMTILNVNIFIIYVNASLMQWKTLKTPEVSVTRFRVNRTIHVLEDIFDFVIESY